jgi:hypothetical protein
MCAGPVIAGSLAVRENQISKETEIRYIGAICLACGHRQSSPTEPACARNILPMEWNSANAVSVGATKAEFVQSISRGEQH